MKESPEERKFREGAEMATTKAVREGIATPTIPTALSDEEMFPHLVREIRNLGDEDRKKFLDTLAMLEKTLEIDDPAKFSAEFDAGMRSLRIPGLLSFVLMLMVLGLPFPANILSLLGGGPIAFAVLKKSSDFENYKEERYQMRARVVRLREAFSA